MTRESKPKFFTRNRNTIYSELKPKKNYFKLFFFSFHTFRFFTLITLTLSLATSQPSSTNRRLNPPFTTSCQKLPNWSPTTPNQSSLNLNSSIIEPKVPSLPQIPLAKVENVRFCHMQAHICHFSVVFNLKQLFHHRRSCLQ